MVEVAGNYLEFGVIFRPNFDLGEDPSSRLRRYSLPIRDRGDEIDAELTIQGTYSFAPECSDLVNPCVEGSASGLDIPVTVWYARRGGVRWPLARHKSQFYWCVCHAARR